MGESNRGLKPDPPSWEGGGNREHLSSAKGGLAPGPQKLAALYVQRDGIYYGLENVDPWDEERDARLYDGPYSVIAHPPCARWCMLASVNEKRWGAKIGEDGGCFEAALRAVRRWGGVLEHPAYSLAWDAFALPKPTRGLWVRSLWDDGWVTEISQSAYGHKARKRTWLYLVGEPMEMDWSDPEGEMMIGNGIHSGEGMGRPKMDKRYASATPLAFRDALIDLALSARDQQRYGEAIAEYSGVLPIDEYLLAPMPEEFMPDV